jgi:HTH-type transcriptional regulator / antitoxin HigA
MDVKPIKTEQDYQETLSMIDNLMNAEINSPEGDLLDILVTLVEAYEQKNYKIDIPDPIEAICFMMQQNQLNRKDIEPFIGNRARVSEILNKKRSLTLPMIRKLHIGLNIPAEILINQSV